MKTAGFPALTLATRPAMATTLATTLAITLAITLVITLVITLASTAQAAPRYGVCRQQITDYVEQQLGLTLTRIDVQFYAERTPPQSLLDVGSALAYVKECKGFLGFEIRATQDLCEHIPHYGSSRGSYIRYQGPFEGCKSG